MEKEYEEINQESDMNRRDFLWQAGMEIFKFSAFQHG